jgi:hypothetical protein
VQGISGEKVQVFLCQEDIHVEGAGKAVHLHTLYDWGATVTLVTHAAAEKAGLRQMRQPAAAIFIYAFKYVPIFRGAIALTLGLRLML